MIHAGLSHLGSFFHALLSHLSYRWHFLALRCLKENVFVSVKLLIPVILRNRSDVAMSELATSCDTDLCEERAIWFLDLLRASSLIPSMEWVFYRS